MNPKTKVYIKEGFFTMNENCKRILTIAGAVMTALSIALSMLAFLSLSVYAETGTGMPAISDIIPGEDGTSMIPFPESGNVDSDDVVTPDDSTRSPVTVPESTTSRPGSANTGTADTADGTDTGMADEEGGGVLGAIIAVIAVVAIILVVIALIPRKKA